MKHEMIGYEDGDWIKFLCPDCERQRWIKHKEDGTVEMRSWGGDPNILHHGNMGPVKIKNPDVSEKEPKVNLEVEAWLKGEPNNE